MEWNVPSLVSEHWPKLVPRVSYRLCTHATTIHGERVLSYSPGTVGARVVGVAVGANVTTATVEN
eukprot:964217-Prorocentrum_minimum.AAC.1